MPSLRRIGSFGAVAGATLATAAALAAGAHPAHASPPRCDVHDLTAKLTRFDAGAGQRYATLVLRNRTGHTCRTFGYVGMQLLAADGRALPTDVVRVRRDAVKAVRLQPGDHAYAVLHWGAIPGPGDAPRGGCRPAPRRVEITPPDSTRRLVLPWRAGAVCERGRIEVEPLHEHPTFPA
jgi:hypothetical protein